MEFLKMQDIKTWFWKRFIDYIFFIWTEGEESLEKFLEDLNKFHPNLKFTYEKSKEKINFLDAVIKIKEGRIITDFTVNLRMVTSIFIMIHVMLII